MARKSERTRKRARRFFWRRAVPTLFSCSAVITALPAQSASAATMPVIRQMATWIESAQLLNGAIALQPLGPGTATIWPDQADLAAAGLAEATIATGDRSYAAAAYRYLTWYAGAENPRTGYTTDWTSTNGGPASPTGIMDSTDAYAGGFLDAAWIWWTATRDRAKLRTLAPGIGLAIRALCSTQQPNGLTWAKPGWTEAYLMDGGFAGLASGAALETALGHTVLANRTAGAARRFQAGVARLWDPATRTFAWAVGAGDAKQATNWADFYPDSMEEVEAIAWGAISGPRAATVMSEFIHRWPNWADPTAVVAQRGSGMAPVGWWPDTALALDLVGRRQQAAAGLSHLVAAAYRTQFAWPFTCEIAGEIILAEVGPHPAPWSSGHL